jgi:uncharacterized protein
MARSVLADAGFLVALLSRGDAHHSWAVGRASQFPPPWTSAESVLSEAFYLLGQAGRAPLAKLIARRALILGFSLGEHIEPVLKLLQKYSDVPMSLADACLVRMTETSGDTVLLTTDRDFRVYRRHGRQVIPCVLPS